MSVSDKATETMMNPGEVWDDYWKKQEVLPPWDYGSYIVYKVLQKELGDFRGKRIAECGSGTGRISLRLVQEGGVGILLDRSDTALLIGRRFFSREKAQGEFIQGTLLALPFREGSCDVAWNAGVLEHFSEEDQVRCLGEMARICGAGGLVVVLCPYRSIFHRVGKAILEKLNRWPYGYEEPVASLAGLGRRVNLRLVKKEYSLGALVYGVEAFRFLIPGNLGLKINGFLRKAAIAAHEGPVRPLIEALDRVVSRLVGGYLLVSVFRRSS